MDDIKFPIAECFVAPQGEGAHAGTLMIFLRLAGCTVGKRYPAERYIPNVDLKVSLDKIDLLLLPILPEYTNQCTLYDGRTFPCDTDYGKKMELGYGEIFSLLVRTHPTCKVICLTGGEPLMHKRLGSLVDNLKSIGGYRIHLETSGTIPLGLAVVDTLDKIDYVAVSPKLGYIPGYREYADEYKILVDANFTSWPLGGLPIKKIYVQPVNGEHTINDENMKRCLALQLEYPSLKISSQSHKLWGVR